MDMLIGYARVSTMDQNPALQMDALKAEGCAKIFTEKASGSHRERPQLQAALDYLRQGDTLVVWKLSRRARSLTQVIKTAAEMHERGIALKVLTQNIDTTTTFEGRLFFHMTAPSYAHGKFLAMSPLRVEGRWLPRPPVSEPWDLPPPKMIQ